MPLPVIALAAVPKRRRATLDLAVAIETRGFAGIYCASFGDALALSQGVASVTVHISFGTSISISTCASGRLRTVRRVHPGDLRRAVSVGHRRQPRSDACSHRDRGGSATRRHVGVRRGAPRGAAGWRAAAHRARHTAHEDGGFVWRNWRRPRLRQRRAIARSRADAPRRTNLDRLTCSCDPEHRVCDLPADTHRTAHDRSVGGGTAKGSSCEKCVRKSYTAGRGGPHSGSSLPLSSLRLAPVSSPGARRLIRSFRPAPGPMFPGRATPDTR